MNIGITVISSDVIHAWTKSKEEFDLIDIKEKVHPWIPSQVTNFVKNDGAKWETRRYTKTLNGHENSMMVIFQWIEERKISSYNMK